MTAISPVDPREDARLPTELRRSPLVDRWAELAARSAARVRLAEEPLLTQVNLRVHPESPAVARIEQALDTRVPRHDAHQVVGDERSAALWLGPDEWLLVAPDGRSAQMVDAVEAALTGALGSAVDVSANRTTLRLSGSHARDVLEKVCSLDLHPRAFSPGHCAQTLLGRTQAILWQLTSEPSYRILVRCSFADYLADLLLDSMAEYG